MQNRGRNRMIDFPQLDKWISGWEKTRQEDREDAKKHPIFKKYVKQDTQVITRLKRQRKRLEAKYLK